MNNLSFTSQGATPFNFQGGMGNSTPSTGGYGATDWSRIITPNYFGGRPYANALNNAQNPPSPQPTTAVKKTTTTNVDGSSTTTEHQPPNLGSYYNVPIVAGQDIGEQIASIDKARAGNSTTSQTTPGLIPPPSQPLASAQGNAAPAGTSGNGSYAPGQAPPLAGGTMGGNQGTQFSTTSPSFPGITGTLANTSAGGSANATAATQGLLNSPQQNANLVEQAQNIGNKYGNAISKISNYGSALGGSYTNGAGLAPVSQGLAGEAQKTTGAEVAGQQSAETAALAPINQELTAQSQAQSGLTAAGGIANTQQANVQSGLTSAGGLAAPGTANVSLGQGQNLVNSQGQTVSSTPVIAPVGTQTQYPVTPTTYTNGQPNANPTSAGYTIQSGDTFDALAGKYGTTAAALESANPGVDPNNLQIGQRINMPQAAGQGSGSPFSGGVAMGQAQLGAELPQLKSNVAAASAVQGDINTLLAENPSLNPSGANALNSALQYVQGQQLSNPQYAELAADLTDYAGKIATVIGALGTQTDAKTLLSQAMVDSSAKGSTVSQVLDNLNKLMNQSISAIEETGAEGIGAANTPAVQSGENQTAGGYTFVKVDGNWHAQ